MVYKADDYSDVYGQSPSEKEQELAVKLGALCRIYEQADRVLTQDPVNVHVMEEVGKPPAWSDGKDVYINRDQIESFDLDELVQINGLNYHELAHLLYTPRRGTDLCKWVIANNDADMTSRYMEAFNILEDQRIETLITARYPSIAPYLTKTIVRWMMQSPELVASNYLAVRGRLYLPVELRVMFRDLFVMPELIPAIIDIVDQYRTLAFPKDYPTAKELIQRFKEEVLDKLPYPQTQPPGGGCTGRPMISKGTPDPGKAQYRDAQRAKGMGVGEPVFVPKASDDSEDKGEEQPNTNTDSAKPSTGDEQPPAIPRSAEEAIKLRELNQEDLFKPRTTGYGEGHVESVGGIPDDVADLLKKLDSEVTFRKDVVQDIKAKQRVIIGGDGKYDETIKKGKYDSVDVRPQILASANKFARELERLRQDCEPAWQLEMPAGKLNVQRVIKGCEIDEAFDRWDEGNDGTDIEAVLLVDRSGSMCSDSNDMRASEASWVIKRAMEHIDCPVTVYSFDNKTELVLDKNTRVSKTSLPFIFGNGGTNPTGSLVASERLLKSSKRKSKVMFLITDGDFDNRHNDEIIERLNAAGVLTVMVLISTASQMQYMEENRSKEYMDNLRHKCAVFGVISNASELVPFARKIVTGLIKSKFNK